MKCGVKLLSNLQTHLHVQVAMTLCSVLCYARKNEQIHCRRLNTCFQSARLVRLHSKKTLYDNHSKSVLFGGEIVSQSAARRRLPSFSPTKPNISVLQEYTRSTAVRELTEAGVQEYGCRRGRSTGVRLPPGQEYRSTEGQEYGSTDAGAPRTGPPSALAADGAPGSWTVSSLCTL